jgi:anti-sigma regulatory factor (Ser/Thr protein kinase)
MLLKRRMIYGECRPTLPGVRHARLQLTERLVDDARCGAGLSRRVTDKVILGFVEYATNLIRHGDPPPMRIMYELMVNDIRQFEFHIWDDGNPFHGFSQELINQRRRPANQRGSGHHHGLYLLMKCFQDIRYIPARSSNPFNHIRLRVIHE